MSAFSDQSSESSVNSVRSAMHEIKALSGRSQHHEVRMDGVERILCLMKFHGESLLVQRVGCHALSNLAMQTAIARHIVSRGGFAVIRSTLARFEGDHQLCWLGASAIWNLSRPPPNRSVIGEDGVGLMLEILRKYRGVEKVVNTSVGALSNLSLCHSLKGVIAREQNMDLILSVLAQYVGDGAEPGSVSVMASGTGLMNNLAVNDDFATMLVRKDAVRMLLEILKWDKEAAKDTLHRNACSALNNLIDARHFLDSFLEHRALEVIQSFLDRASSENDDNALCANLLQNCLMEIEVDPLHRDTTSFHLCADRGNLHVLKRLIAEHPYHDLDAVDSEGSTCLDHAVRGKYLEIIVFLSKCGAVRCTETLNADDCDVDIDGNGCAEIKEAVLDGKRTLQGVIDANRNVLIQTLPEFPTAICHLVTSFIGNVDMLKASGQFK